MIPFSEHWMDAFLFFFTPTHIGITFELHDFHDRRNDRMFVSFPNA